MKVKNLIALLQKADPELPVVMFLDGGAEEVSRADVYEVEYIVDWEKMGVKRETGIVVGIGHPGNFDETMYDKDCHLVKEL